MYVLVNKRGYVTDYVFYPYENYVKVLLHDVVVPRDLTKGYYYVNEGVLEIDKDEREVISKLSHMEYLEKMIEIEDRLQHGMSNTKAIKSDVEQLEEQLAMETMSGVEKEMKIQKLEEENEFMQEQLAMEAMESLQKSQKISELKKENEEIQEQVAMETMNGLELEMRVSAIENKIEKDDK